MRSYFFIVLLLAGCFKQQEVRMTHEPHQAPNQTQVVKRPALAKKEHTYQVQLELVSKLMIQADQIHREAWRVIADEKLASYKSPFGKVARASLLELHGSLLQKGIFQCDRYRTEFLKAGKEIIFYQMCSVSATSKNSGVEFANWSQKSLRSGVLRLQSSALAETLGLATSLFGQKISCEISWTEQNLIEAFTCPRWEQDKGAQIVRLDIYDYTKDKNQLLKMRGHLIENLQPVRKISADVPLEGKISVVETELIAPPDEPMAPILVPPKTNDEGRGNAPVVVDPDLFIQRNNVQPLPEPEYIETPASNR
jgi:hypothetical protein